MKPTLLPQSPPIGLTLLAITAMMWGVGPFLGFPPALTEARAASTPSFSLAATPNPPTDGQRIAVVDFRALGCTAAYGEAVAENFRNALIAEDRYVVLERAQIQHALKEQIFGRSGLVDQSKVVALGRLIGARYIVVGSITLLGRTYTVNARFIDVQTGQASNARSVTAASADELAEVVSDLAKDFSGGSSSDNGEDDAGDKTDDSEEAEEAQPASTKRTR